MSTVSYLSKVTIMSSEPSVSTLSTIPVVTLSVSTVPVMTKRTVPVTTAFPLVPVRSSSQASPGQEGPR